MSEEMNRREAELSEQELSGVSGGYGAGEAIEDAKIVCEACYTAKPSSSREACLNEHMQDLIHYLMKHGRDSVRLPQQCPYYK